MSTDPRTTQVEHDGLTFDIALDGPGDGVPVLLLHGFPQTSRSWRGVTDRLAAAGLATAAPDQRGYSPGARPAAVEAYATELIAGDALAVADALGWDTFHLVGHDWGSSVAWWLAGHHPERLRSLVAVSVPHLAAYGWALRHDAEQQEAAAYVGMLREVGSEERLRADDGAWLREAYAGLPEMEAAYYRRHFTRTDPGALEAGVNWYRAMSGGLGRLPAVTVPTTYVWSTGDRFLTRAGALRCGEHVAAPFTYEELGGVSHWIPDERPGTVASAVLAHTDR